MLFSFEPVSFVQTPIRPSIASESLLFIKEVLALIPHSIGIDINAIAMHVVVEPLAVVLATIFPKVGTQSVDLVLTPLSLVVRAVRPNIVSISMLLASQIRSSITSTFSPCLHTLSLLQVILPIAIVLGAFAVYVYTFTVGLIAVPLPRVDVPADMSEFSVATCLPQIPVPII